MSHQHGTEAMVLREKLYTAEEFFEIAALPENEDRRLELEDGMIIEMPSSRRINTVTGLGWVMMADCQPAVAFFGAFAQKTT